jgi:fructose-1,6-bisphosphatase I
MVSEENSEVIRVKSANGRYLAVFDPLDGSSNIDANVSIGTIFGVYQCKKGVSDDEQIIATGREMVAAGYCVYGSATVLGKRGRQKKCNPEKKNQRN